MIQKFDIFGIFETPNIWLCNPNKQRVGLIKTYTDQNVILRFNDMQEITLKVPYIVGVTDHIYNKVVQKRLLEIDNIGYFLINSVKEYDNGIERYREVTSYSLEAELQYRKINMVDGTYKFYDLINPENTLMNMIFDGQTNWTIGYVDPDLMNKYRTFEIPDSTIYQFLMNDVETAYECIFVFNSFERQVSAYYLPNFLQKTGIYLTFDNLIKEAEIQEEAEELVTQLKVYGQDIDIRQVNPTGSDAIYNFQYFKNQEWMQQDLIDALNQWEEKIQQNADRYKQLLVDRQTTNQQLIQLKSQLADLQSEYDSLEGVMKVRIEAGQDISDIKQQMDAKQQQINQKNQEISQAETALEQIDSYLSEISTQLKIENNITGQLWTELIPYIIQNTYQNETFVVNSEMDEVEKQQMAQDLYDMGENVLSRVATPRFTFSLDSTNFIYLQELQPFTKQLNLGQVINVEVSYGKVTPIILEIEFSFDDPTLLNFTFGNRYKLDSSEYEFSDLFGDAISGGTQVKFDSAKWGEYVNSGMNNEVSNFINSALDAAKNNVINQSNQEIVINQNGLRGRQMTEDGDYSNEQCWLTSNTLAFTKDNWNTAQLALGKITFNNQSVYGVVADALVGKIVAGNQLWITNDNNSFLLDENGAVLNNAQFTIVKGNNTIKLDPESGIEVLNGDNQQMWIDPATGNLNIAGTITATSGSIGGFQIGDTYLKQNNGVIQLNADGSATIGALSISTNGNSTFRGNVYADYFIGNLNMDRINGLNATVGSLQAEDASIRNLVAQEIAAVNGRFNNISANNITSGTLSANRIAGGQLQVNKLNIDGSQAYLQNQNVVTSINYNTTSCLQSGTTLQVTKNQFGYVTNVQLVKQYQSVIVPYLTIQQKTLRYIGYETN